MALDDTTTDEVVDDGKNFGGLYQHGSRPEWGLATRVDFSDGRYTYQFEDGRLRRFALTHNHLMVEVHRPFDEGERLRKQLADMAGKAMAHRSLRDNNTALISLDQQVGLFEADFPEGFEDPAWLKQHRGSGTKGAKRLREPAIARAQELLNIDVITELVGAGQYDDVMARVHKLLASTSMLSARQIAPLAEMDADSKRRAGDALRSLISGDVDLSASMRDWVSALASTAMGVSWSLATAAPALIKPAEQFCVRASVFTLQVRWMAPREVLPKMPSGPSYVRLREVAFTLRDELGKRKHAPRDMLDVYDFVWWTLRPASQKRIAAMGPPPKPAGSIHPDAPTELATNKA